MNTKNIRLSLACAVALLAAGVAHAGKVSAVRADTPSIVAGTQAKITVDGDDEAICGLRLEYGNGDVDVTKMSAGRDMFPRVFVHTYAQPGTFTIVAKGGRDGNTLGCSGNASTTITVVAPPPGAISTAWPSCPDGYKLDRRSVSKRSGAFNCTGMKGAQLPPSGIACPAGTAYFTNTRGTLLGCKPQR
ncbi:MAG: hypothetical protein JWN73_3789 [Betaproteobacteria bacterium]|nr:hypothetical protein [Betaproteobacteria bacterium]